MQLNIFALSYLVAFLVLLCLFKKLSEGVSFNKARENYNYTILMASFWMLADFVEYSATSIVLAEYSLVLVSFFISLTVFFLIRTILELEGKKNKILPAIPIAFFAFLSPFFKVVPSRFVAFNDAINPALVLFNVIELAFFVYFICSIHFIRKKIKSKESRKKLLSIQNALLLITFFSFSYYFVSLYFLLPPLTWISAIIYTTATYPVFKKK